MPYKSLRLVACEGMNRMRYHTEVQLLAPAKLTATAARLRSLKIEKIIFDEHLSDFPGVHYGAGGSVGIPPRRTNR